MKNSNEIQITSLGWALHSAGCLLVIAIVTAYYMFVTSHMNEEMNQYDLRVSQLEAFNERAPKVRSAYSKSKAELDALEQSVEKANLRLPADLDEKEFIEQFRLMADSLGIVVGDYQLGDPGLFEGHARAALSFQCSGSYASICRLLDGIHHSPRLADVSHLSIETNTNKERYSLKVTFDLYFGGKSNDKSIRGEVL